MDAEENKIIIKATASQGFFFRPVQNIIHTDLVKCSVSSMKLADCNVLENLNEVRLCETASLGSSYILLGLRRGEWSNLHFKAQEKEASPH